MFSCDTDVCCIAQGKRYMLPNTTMMMHHPSGVARGQASDIQNEAKELLRVRNYCNAVLSNATGQPVEKVSMGRSLVSNTIISIRGKAAQSIHQLLPDRWHAAPIYISCYWTCDSPLQRHSDSSS